MNELELLAVIWAVDRFKHYLLGKEFILATDHKALTSTLSEYKSNKTYQSRLTRWVDRLLPYQFKVVHKPGKVMGVVDYMSREPNEEPWPETYIDEKFVVASIECFHKELDCLNSRLNVATHAIQNDNFLEHSGSSNTLDETKAKSSHGCYSNRSVQKRSRLDRNKNGPISSFSNCETNILSTISHCKQSVDSKQNTERRNRMEENPKKTVKIVERERSNRNQLLEQVTEMTYRRTRTVQRGNETDGSEDDMPQVEWRKMGNSPKMDITQQRRVSGQATSIPTYFGNTRQSESRELISFWDLVGSERADKVIPGSLLELEATTYMSSPQNDNHSPGGKDRKIKEVDLTCEIPTSSSEDSLVGGRQNARKSRKDEFRLAEHLEDNNLHILSKLFDQNLLAELTTEDTWVDRLRKVIEQKDRHSFELMGTYTNSL